MKYPNEYKDLTRTNRMVYRKYCKASDYQKSQMRTTLKEQLDNLKLLYSLMRVYDF